MIVIKMRGGKNARNDELEIVYQKYYRSLFLFTLSFTQNQEDAKDLFEFGSSTLKGIEDLLDSSQFNVTITFDKAYIDMTVLWMAIDSYLIDLSLADGISLWKSSMYDLTLEAKKK